MKKRIFAVIGFFLFSLFAFAGEIITLEPRTKKELAKERDTAIRIECNVKNARIYLNNNYQGYSNLTIKDLRPGRYKLELQKTGYESQVYYIQVRAKLELGYFIEMEELPIEIETEDTIESEIENSASDEIATEEDK